MDMFKKNKGRTISSCITASQRAVLSVELNESINNVVLTQCVMGFGFEMGCEKWYQTMGSLIVPATMDFILDGALDMAGIDIVRNKIAAKK